MGCGPSLVDQKETSNTPSRVQHPMPAASCSANSTSARIFIPVVGSDESIREEMKSTKLDAGDASARCKALGAIAEMPNAGLFEGHRQSINSLETSATNPAVPAPETSTLSEAPSSTPVASPLMKNRGKLSIRDRMKRSAGGDFHSVITTASSDPLGENVVPPVPPRFEELRLECEDYRRLSLDIVQPLHPSDQQPLFLAAAPRAPGSPFRSATAARGDGSPSGSPRIRTIHFVEATQIGPQRSAGPPDHFSVDDAHFGAEIQLRRASENSFGDDVGSTPSTSVASTDSSATSGLYPPRVTPQRRL